MEEGCEMLSSGHGMAIVLMNSSQLWWPAQYQVIQNSNMARKELMEPHTWKRSDWQLMVTRGGRINFIWGSDHSNFSHSLINGHVTTHM